MRPIKKGAATHIAPPRVLFLQPQNPGTSLHHGLSVEKIMLLSDREIQQILNCRCHVCLVDVRATEYLAARVSADLKGFLEMERLEACKEVS